MPSDLQTVLYFGELYEVRSGAGTIHLFAGNQRIASVLLDGRTQFYHTNHLGSASVITDGYGNRKERMEYFPFGTYREAVDYDANFPDVFYTFTGQEDDDDLGLYNYNARLYDPVLGRFISPDRLVPDPGDPQSLNRYTYCLNNPLIYTDPSGEFIWLIVAVVIGSFSGAYQANKAGENPWKGAMLGAIIGATSYYAAGVVGFYVSELITPTVVTATNTGAVSAANIVSATAGGFAGGATAGALNAAAYGGNVWQSALYGGLIGAAIAGTVQGAIELNNWATSNSLMKDERSMYAQNRTSIRDVEPLTTEEVASHIYGETSGIRPGASTPEELARARESIGRVYMNRAEAGMGPGMRSATPDINNPVQMRQWNLSLETARNALNASQDPTGGAVHFNIRESSQINPTTRPHAVFGPVRSSFGPFYNLGGGDVIRGSVYINIYR